jgi:hypothetical protein
MKLTDCYYEKKDWRACKKEVSVKNLLFEVRGCTRGHPRRCRAVIAARGGAATRKSSDQNADLEQMEVFRECWKRHNNDQRTATKDA